MQKRKDLKISIPEGHFEGYCGDCFYGKKNNTDAKGRILCKGEPGGYRIPDERNECRHFAPRIRTWIKIILWGYFLITGVVVFLELFIF